MLQPDLINLSESSLNSLLCKIDERLLVFSKNKWLKLAYDVDKYYNREAVEWLIFYKKILLKRLYNPSYACTISLEDIKTRINVYLNK